jgi:tetratricopeptide (TPR) repeat protein
MIKKSFTIVLFLLFCYQVTGQRATRQSAQDAFNRGDYRKAYNDYNELLNIYSRDPLYKYYASVCLIKLEQDPEQAEALIKEAIENNTAARTIPSDAIFYHARALQMNGKFDEAVKLYQRFADQAGRRTARELGVADYIQQCSRREGALAKTQPERQIAPEHEITNSAAIPLFTKPEIVVERETTPVLTLLSGNYSDMLDKALSFQFLADSVRRVNAAQRASIGNLPNEANAKLAENERLAVSYQTSADELFAAAQALINSKPEDPKTPPAQPEINRAVEIINKPPINIEIEEKIITAPIVTNDVYYYFEILNNPSSGAIQIDPEIPEGLNYRIQMGAFRNPVSPEFFKGVTPVYGITNTNTGVKTYYAGMFRRIADVRNALTEVKNAGFKDSFIVQFLGNNVVSADRAAVLEREWGTKPFERVVGNKSIQIPVAVTASADTLPPTLVFRVEVMRVTRAATPAAVETLRTLAGNRGLDIVNTADRQIAYIIGNFITYSSATEYADLLVRNGYRDTKVVAWLGNREIAVETARQLFEGLE